jgi:hypothetical protein
MLGYSLFLPGFEKWITNIISANLDKPSEQIIQLVNGRIKSGIKANIEYHNMLANASPKAKDDAVKKYHKLIAQIYESLCKS